MASGPNNRIIQREIDLILRAHFERPTGTAREIWSTANGESKTTLYVGSPRHAGRETFPEIVLSVLVAEVERMDGYGSAPLHDGLEPGMPAMRMNVTVPGLDGAEVVFTLVNCFQKQTSRGLEYKARLKMNQANLLEAKVTIDPTGVQKLFAPDSRLGCRVNENLLDFQVVIPALGRSAGSINRILVYRKRHVVFIPGLLGSTIAVHTKSGPVQVYPNLYPTVTPDQESEVGRWFRQGLYWAGTLGGGAVADAVLHAFNVAQHRKLGLLECDSDGKPLLRSRVELFRFGGAIPFRSVKDRLPGAAIVYDVESVFLERLQEWRDMSNWPEDHNPFSIEPWPYDWRLDLEDTAQGFWKEIEACRDALRARPDTDDRLVLSGHSTGGVIMRRICGLKDADAYISHAFFMNAPFRGAPKALGVLLTGGEPLNHGQWHEMMPGFMIGTQWIMYVGNNFPILYYLSPSARYPMPVSTVGGALKDRVAQHALPGLSPRDQEKRTIVELLADLGFYVRGRAVQPGGSDQDRQTLALTANDWHVTWWECGRRMNFRPFWGSGELEAFNARWLKAADDYEFQHQNRSADIMAWNDRLARKAGNFHEASEANIESSGVELYVHWSTGTNTTGSVDLVPVGPPVRVNVTSEGLGVRHFVDGDFPEIDISANWDFKFKSYYKEDGITWCQKYQLKSEIVPGDGTVPQVSLVGIGSTRAKVFQPIPGDPAHVPAPNSTWVWDRIVEVMLGYDVAVYLLTPAQVARAAAAPL